MHIKLPGTADGEQAFTVCGRRCLHLRGGKCRNEGERKRKGVEEEGKEEMESRSSKVLCLWMRGKHGDKGHRRRIRPWGKRGD